MLAESCVLLFCVYVCASFVLGKPALSPQQTSRASSATNLIRLAELVYMMDQLRLHDGSKHALFHVFYLCVGLTAVGRSFT